MWLLLLAMAPLGVHTLWQDEDDTMARVNRALEENPEVRAELQRMSAYDAAYAAAAEAFDARLVTVDARLVRACRDGAIPATHLDELAR